MTRSNILRYIITNSSNKIRIIKHSGSATTVEQTDCGSFAKK